MKQIAHVLVLGSMTALFSASALADHNSPNGAGWANMPNDIHNTRIEDGLSGSEFADFVRQGAGADAVNRYLDTTTPQSGGGTTPQGGSRR
ncbi:MAG: hypothetical protein KJ946_10630 [Gammaproteobacteria bacterium]|nr:hypothetical protein [Gammaproteobacteria bacterium]